MFYNRLWLWLLKKFKNMCNCKNKCNCSSSDFAEGLNGYNSFNYTTSQFAIPAADNTTPVTINVKSERPWTGEAFGIGSFVFIEGNYLRVTNVTENTITVVNPETSTLYTTNDAPGTLIPANTKITQTGQQGLQGPAPIIPTYSESGTIFFDNTNQVQSTAYFQLEFLNIENLINDFDSIEIESIIRYNDALTTTLGGYKFQVDGNDIQEYTSSDLASLTDFKYILHKMTITRITSTSVSIRSLIQATFSDGTLNSNSPEHLQSFLFTSPAVTDSANLPVRFLLRNSNNTQLASQVVLQVKYIPYIQ